MLSGKVDHQMVQRLSLEHLGAVWTAKRWHVLHCLLPCDLPLYVQADVCERHMRHIFGGEDFLVAKRTHLQRVLLLDGLTTPRGFRAPVVQDNNGIGVLRPI